MTLSSKRTWLWLIASAVLALTLLVAANWRSSLILAAAAGAERRPPLLRDAAWDAPQTARRFNRRFRAGAPEQDLKAWLVRNRFKVNAAARTARRDIAGFPCAETIRVTWKTDSDGRLTEAQAVVRQIACL